MEIRPMRWPDITEVAQIEAEVFEVDAWSVEQFWGELAQPTREYIVAQDEEHIVGYAGIYLLPPDADVQTIAVRTDASGRGVGRLLLNELINRASAHGCTSMMLEVRSDSAAAVHLYTSTGFEQISRRTDYYAPGVHAHVMRLRPLTLAGERGVQ
jgi:ribosomal-protein-alanine N-acetyltransferase